MSCPQDQKIADSIECMPMVLCNLIGGYANPYRETFDKVMNELQTKTKELKEQLDYFDHPSNKYKMETVVYRNPGCHRISGFIPLIKWLAVGKSYRIRRHGKKSKPKWQMREAQCIDLKLFTDKIMKAQREFEHGNEMFWSVI